MAEHPGKRTSPKQLAFEQRLIGRDLNNRIEHDQLTINPPPVPIRTVGKKRVMNVGIVTSFRQRNEPI